jgi:phage gp29-like protein
MPELPLSEYSGADPYSLLGLGIDDNPNPPMVNPRMEVSSPIPGIMIDVEVKDRLLVELKRRLFPSDIEGVLYSAITGDLYWQDQLFQIMIDTWPRLQTNLNKLKRAVSRLTFTVDAYRENEKDPTPSAIAKANLVRECFDDMTPNLPFQEHDFKETVEDIVEAIPTGFVISEVYWEYKKGKIGPRCTRRIPARYYRYPYQTDATDRLMLNPSGTLGGTDLYDFPPYKFLTCIKQTSVAHPVFSAMMRCLAAWWVASRFGLEWFMNYSQLFGIPFRKATYQVGDNLVYNRLVQMMKQAGSASWGVFPEGTEVEILSAPSTSGNMPQERLLELADKVCDILLLGQTLTTEVGVSGSRALGGVHKEVLDEIIESSALWAAKILNTQLIPGIVRFNFGSKEPLELPTLDPVIKNPIDLLQTAHAFQILFGKGPGQMGIPVKKEEIYDRLEFSVPDEDADLLEPLETSQFGPVSEGDGSGGETETQNSPQQNPGAPATKNMKNPKSQQPPQKGPRSQNTIYSSRDGEPVVMGPPKLEILVQHVLENVTGVSSEWTRPVKPYFRTLCKLAMDESVTDKDFEHALRQAQAHLPELFSELNTQKLIDAMESSMSTAFINGLQDSMQTMD